MEFKEWLASTDYTVWDNAEMTAEAAWDYQQASIDGLLEDRKMDRSRINDLENRAIDSRRRIYDLEHWIKGIADDKQMPTWIQQSARSLLAQEGDLSMTVPEGYAIVPIEPTKSMIDAGLGADSDAFPLKYIYQAMIEAAQEGE
jgi:hypothetical protein